MVQRPGPGLGLVGAPAGSMTVIARADNLTACTRTHNPAGPPIRFSTFYHGVSTSATGTSDRTLSGWPAIPGQAPESAATARPDGSGRPGAGLTLTGFDPYRWDLCAVCVRAGCTACAVTPVSTPTSGGPLSNPAGP